VGLVVFVVLGGKDGLQFLVLAVVCTAGAGLVVVIPGAYLIGLLCTIWFIPYGNRAIAQGGEPLLDGRENRSRGGNGKPSSRISALGDYIGAAEARGEKWEGIREELIRLGWDEKTIALARGQADPKQEWDFQ